MALTVEEFKAAWGKKADDMRAQAVAAAAEDTRPQDIEKLMKRVEQVDKTWSQNDVDKWPDAPKEALGALRVSVDIRRNRALKEDDTALRQPILAEAFQILDQLEEKIKSTGRLRAVCKEQQSTVAATGKIVSKTLKTKTKELGEEDGNIKRLLAVKNSILERYREVKNDIAAIGQFELATVEFRKLIVRMNQLNSDLNALEFAEFQTVTINQGTFKRPESDIPILDEVDSQGVCKAMVLDFLSVGGSHQEAGTPVQAQITSQHFQAQNAYGLALKQAALDSVDVFAHSELPAELDDLNAQLVTSQQGLDYAEAAVRNLQQQVIGVDAQITDSNRMINARQESWQNINANVPATLPEKAQMLQAIATEIEQYRAQLTDQQRQKVAAEDLLRQWQAHLLVLQGAHQDLVDKKTDASNRARALMETTKTLADKATELQKDFADKKAMSGPLLPSSVLDQFGLSLVEDSLETTTPADKTLTGDEVVSALTRFINGLDAGATTAAQISVQFTEGGHAIGLRVTKPGDSVPDWDIEFFDPNANGYRFDDLGKFTGFLPKFYKVTYSETWTSFSVFKLDVAQEKPVDDPSSLLGPTVAAAWAEDWGAVQSSYEKVLYHPNLPSVLVQQAKDLVKKIEGVFPMHDPASGTHVDLSLARNYLMQLGTQCKTMLAEQDTYDALQAEAMRSVTTSGNQAAREQYAQAISTHADGDIPGAYFHLNETIERCDAQGWENTRAASETAYLSAIKDHPERATEFRSVLAFADQSAEAGDYIKAVAAVERLKTKIAEADTTAAEAQTDAMNAWQRARATVIQSLLQLEARIQAGGHKDAGKAVVEIKSIVSNLISKPNTEKQVDDLAQYISGDAAITDIESPNPYKIKIELRKTLTGPLSALKEELAA
ncbi:MAG: hypothetical protein AAF252_03100 [Pseudomonadota bacterium]